MMALNSNKDCSGFVVHVARPQYVLHLDGKWNAGKKTTALMMPLQPYVCQSERKPLPFDGRVLCCLLFKPSVERNKTFVSLIVYWRFSHFASPVRFYILPFHSLLYTVYDVLPSSWSLFFGEWLEESDEQTLFSYLPSVLISLSPSIDRPFAVHLLAVLWPPLNSNNDTDFLFVCIFNTLLQHYSR